MKNSNIYFCNKCILHKNQKPLLDKKQKADVMWVGLSAKKVEDITNSVPLDVNTNSGKIVAEIENQYKEKNFYKTNLVKCLPLDENNKLRYPFISECAACFANFELEIQEIDPFIIILLGKKVADFVLGRYGLKISKLSYDCKVIQINGRLFLPVLHPSYIAVFKRKEKDQYAQSIKRIIDRIK